MCVGCGQTLHSVAGAVTWKLLDFIGLYCAVDSLSLSRTQAEWEATEVSAVKT